MKEDLVKLKLAEVKANSLLYDLKTFLPDLFNVIDDICKENFDEGLYEFVRTEALQNSSNDFEFFYKSGDVKGFITLYNILSDKPRKRYCRICCDNEERWINCIPLVTIKIYNESKLENKIEYFVDKKAKSATVYRKNMAGVVELTKFEQNFNGDFEENQTIVIEPQN